MIKNINSVRLQKTLDGGVAVHNRYVTGRGIAINAAAKKSEDVADSTKITAGAPSASMQWISPNNQVKTLDGFLPEIDIKNTSSNKLVYEMYEDIYLHDAICGGAVDFMSTIPFGNFSMTTQEQEHLAPYEACVNKLNLKENLPLLASDYFTYGTYVGSLNFNSQLRYFDYLATHKLEDCEIEYPPVENMDPIVTAQMHCDWANSTDPKYDMWRQHIPKYLQSNKRITLCQASTLYVVRNTSASQVRGVSLFDRVLMVCLFEKFLLRGTCARVARRLAPITQIKVGNETHVPTDEELQAMADMFINLDADPISATVATRDDVDVIDVKNGADFYKWDDIFEIATSAKYRALGFSEDLLNGNTTLANMEANMNFLLQKEQKVRDSIQRQVFNKTIFAGIAITNRHLTGDDSGELIAGKYYDIPEITWDDPLRPATDDKLIEMLDKLAEKGVPVPLRMLAAAGNVDIDKLLSMQDEDKELRETLGMSEAATDGFDDGGYDDFGAASTFDKIKAKFTRNPLKRNYQTEHTQRYSGLHLRDTANKRRPHVGASQHKLERAANVEIVKSMRSK